MSEVGKIMTFTFTSYKSSKGTFSVLKCIKTYIGSNMGNNRLHALILVYIRKNILNNTYVLFIVLFIFPIECIKRGAV